MNSSVNMDFNYSCRYTSLKNNKICQQNFICVQNYLPMERGVALHLNKLESPSLKDALCQVWLKQAQRFLRRFLNFVNIFSRFHNYFPLEKGKALYLNKRILCAKYGWNWLGGSRILSSNFAIINYLPLEKGGALIWTNLNPQNPRMLCAKFTLVEIGPVVLEEKILKFCQCIFSIL